MQNGQAPRASEGHVSNGAADHACAEHPQSAGHQTTRRLAETYTFALLQWPALFLLLELDNSGWQQWLQYALGLWIALIALAAYGGRREDRVIFANAMSIELAVLWLVWWTFPGYWCWLWIGIAAALFYTAQSALLTSQDKIASSVAEH